MFDYLKALAAKSVGVFLVTLTGAVGADQALNVGVSDWGSAFEVSAAAVVATVLWPAVTKFASRLQATKVPEIKTF